MCFFYWSEEVFWSIKVLIPSFKMRLAMFFFFSNVTCQFFLWLIASFPSVLHYILLRLSLA